MMPQEVEGVFPLNNFRRRPPGGGVYPRHDLQQMKPLPELYGWNSNRLKALVDFQHNIIHDYITE